MNKDTGHEHHKHAENRSVPFRLLWLTVTQIQRAGAVLDGRDADPPLPDEITGGDPGHIWLPFKSQTAPITAGQRIFCAVFKASPTEGQRQEDRIRGESRRSPAPRRDTRDLYTAVATMNVYPYLEDKSPYVKGDRVTGTVYETSNNFGVFVAVDDRYHALIPLRECYGDIRIGEPVKNATVVSVREDGRLVLKIREDVNIQMDKDAAVIMERLSKEDGSIPFSDRSSPEVIRSEFNMSKSEFKRAVGRLLKLGKIELSDDSITMK